MLKPRAKLPFSEEGLQAMLIRVLRPLVKLALASGFNFTSFSVVLRRLYIEVAESDFALANKQQTDSRISLLTGIHRKDVSKHRGQGLTSATPPLAVSQTGRLVARWLADPNYCDDTGAPRPLARTAADDGPSFERLVSEGTKDVHPRAVLDEWLDRGIVSLDQDAFVHLDLSTVIPNAGDDALRHYFTRNLHDHTLAAVTNIMNEPPPYFERAVHYDQISSALAARLDAIARAEAMAMLLRLNKIAHQAVQADTGGDSRWITGIYVMPQDEKPAQPATVDARTEADE
jgi:hypothetical protein